MSDPEVTFLTAPEVAELLHTPIETLYAWRYQGIGPPASRIGKRLLYDRDEVITWVKAQK
jgi:predicted DNA-binding transcriptional regulator AlpA